MRAGYAEVDITPQWPVELCGYGYYLGRTFKGVHDPLRARALAVEGDSSTVLLLSCDLIGFGTDYMARLKEAVRSETGVAPEAVMVACIHTHSGPATAYLRGCGVQDDGYMEWLFPRLVESCRSAVAGLSPVSDIRWAEVPVEGVAYNRVYGEAGPVDPMARMLVFAREGARPIAVVNYGCHPVANGVNWDVSADYPGHVVRRMEEAGFDCLFVTGFCGDIDPMGDRGYECAAQCGRAVASTAIQSLDSAQSVDQTGPRFDGVEVTLDYHKPSKERLLAGLAAARDRLESDTRAVDAIAELSWMIDALRDMDEPHLPSSVIGQIQAFTIGDVAFVALPGEVFTRFGLDMRAEGGFDKLVLVNAANGLVGYIPTADEFDRRGYASHGAAHIYSTYRLTRGFGERVAEEGIGLLRRMVDDGGNK